MIPSRPSSWARAGAWLLLLLLWVAPARAQEPGVPRIQDEALGPYQLTVWTSPEPPQVGRLHVTARLLAETGEPTTAPALTLHARAPHRDVIEATMHPDGQDALYQADLDIPYTAIWTIELDMDDGERTETTSFSLDIQPAPIDKNLIRLGAFATLVVLFIGWWFWGRHPRKKRVRKRIFMPRPDEKE